MMEVARHRMSLLRCLLFAMAAASGQAAAAEERPNILFIVGDNWAWPHAGALGDPLAATPAFDRIAREGVVFTHTFNPVPSCSPTRACILCGKAAHQLGERANLWSGFPRDTPVVAELLAKAGYEVGFCGKGWAPGDAEGSGWKENPVGRKFDGFEEFEKKRDRSKPFFFWLGNTDTATRGGTLPYLEYAEGKIDPAKIVVPPELPDCPEARLDLMNYYGGVMKLDEEAAAAIAVVERSGGLDRTAVVYTSDNGWQMPRGLANCYDAGSRVPLAVRWGGKTPAGTKVEAFVNVADLGPTFLELAGVAPPREMSMKSILNLALGRLDPAPRDAVFIERERHADVRKGGLSYPVRAVRTRDFLYVRNLRPDRWPAGDPDVRFIHDRPYGDVDTTRTKDFLLKRLDDPAFAKYVALIFGKRPAEELYDLARDPRQIENVADRPEYADRLAKLRGRVDAWMRETDDPRCDPGYDGWDHVPYHGRPSRAD